MPKKVYRLPKRVKWGSVLILVCAMGVGLQPFAPAQERQYLTGQLLVATPEMRDPRFAETVIYMARHDEEGAMGLVVNKPIATGPISELLKWLGVKGEGKESSGEITIHFGGPVGPGLAFMIHSDDYVTKDTMVVRDGFAVTSADVEVLRAITSGKGPRRNLFVMGYAGWAPGQLEAEIKRNDWFLIPAEKELIFGSEAKKKWKRAMDKRRIRT